MAAQQIGIVNATKGEVFARNPEGQVRRLAKGDPVFEREVIITAAGSSAQIEPMDGRMINVNEQQTVSVDGTVVPGVPVDSTAASVTPLTTAEAARVIQDPNALLEEEAAAAGLTGGEAGAGHGFVDLVRITEGVGGAAYDFPVYDRGGPQLPGTGGDIEGGVPTAGNLDIALDEDDISYRRGPDFRETSWFEAFSGSVGYPGGRYANGNNDLAPGDDLPRPSPTTMVGNLNLAYGPDGVGGLVFNLPTAALESGGNPLKYWLSADGHSLVGYIEEGYQSVPTSSEVGPYALQISELSFVKVIFAAEITDVASGGFAFTLYGPLDHEAGLVENNLIIPLSFTVTDATGDAAIGTLTVNVDDDMPVASCHPMLYAVLEEESVPGGEDGTIGNNEKLDWVGVLPTQLSHTTGMESILDAVRWGADGFGRVLSVTVGGQTFLANQSGPTMVYFDQSGHVIADGGETTAAAVLVFDASGRYMLSVIGPMAHDLDGSAAENFDIKMLPMITFNAQDGDEDPIAVRLYAGVQDDRPTVSANATVTLDDEGLKGGLPGQGPGDVPGEATEAQGVLGHDFGADANGRIDFAAMNGTTATVGTETVAYAWNTATNTLTATGPRGLLFSVEVNPSTGAYKVTLADNVLHTPPSSGGYENDATVTLTYTVTDGDGDKVDGKLKVSFDDDMPVAQDVARSFVEPAAVALVVSGLQAGFVGAVGDQNANFSYSNTDSDTYKDTVAWGQNGRSSYTLADSVLFQSTTGSPVEGAFKLGTFTHNNQTIQNNTSLDSVNLVLKFLVGGVEVNHTVKLNHNETPNTNDPIASRDIITLVNTTLTKSIVVNGQTYELNIEGFKDAAGNLVTSIYTKEGQSNSFDLYASLKPVGSAVVLEGTVAPAYGADGAGEVLWDGATRNPDGSYTITNEYGTFTGYSNGGYKFVAGSYDVNAAETMSFGFTVRDADGDEAHATLRLTTTDRSEVVAYDNYALASVTEVPVAPIEIPALAEFRNWSQNHILNTEADRWGRTSANDTVLNADGSLRMSDGNQSANNYSVVVSEGLVIKSTSDAIKFDVTVANKQSNDTFTWKVMKLGTDGSSWTEVAGKGGTLGNGFADDLTVSGLAAGTYRLYFEVNDRTQSDASGGEFTATLKDLMVSYGEGYADYLAEPVSGNVIVDPNNYPLSADPQGAVDDPGDEGAALSVWNGTAYVEPTTAGITINGQWGDLLIKSDGSYTYTPDADPANAGKTETFSYMLTQPDGDSDAANLIVKIGFNDYIAGTSGNDNLVGGSGDDTLVGGMGRDRLEGGPGSDAYVWRLGDFAGDSADRIVGFNKEDGDVLDLEDMLQGETVANLSTYLSFAQAGDHTVLTIADTNGSASGGNYDTITFENTNLFADFDAASNTELISKMLQNGNLKVDV